MADRILVGAGAAAGSAPEIYVITLVSSPSPVAMRAPDLPGLEGLAVFRSRRVEDGRERFRLHLGYFPSAADAEVVLARVRAGFPTAFISVAPESDLGSLDDTALTRFSVLRPIGAEEPAAVPAPTSPLPVEAAVAVGAPAIPVLAIATAVCQAPLPPAPVHQHYALQLVGGRLPVDLARVPVLAIFEGYTLYAVEAHRDERRFYGVRLGFYADVLSARLVAQYVRSEFASVTIVPVSERERLRAVTALISLPAARQRRGAPPPQPRWPETALPVEPIGPHAPIPVLR